MYSKRPALIVAGLLILASVAACTPIPPATQAPAQQPAATQAALVVTDTPAPTATPTPAVPDPKTDATGALLYASNGKLFRTAEFTYTMTMTMAPADDASVKALGTQADQLKNFKMEANGSGAMEVTDPTAFKSKMRMDMDVNASGQRMKMQMILIDQTAWVRLAGQDAWQEVDAKQAQSITPGMSPEKMLEDFKNAANVEWVEDVTQGSETLSHLRFTMDYTKLDIGSLTSGLTENANLTPEQIETMLKGIKPVFDVWLTKPGLELRGEKLQLDFVMPLPAEANASDAKLRISMLMDMQYSKVNELVTIEPPAEATSLPATATPTK